MVGRTVSRGRASSSSSRRDALRSERRERKKTHFLPDSSLGSVLAFSEEFRLVRGKKRVGHTRDRSSLRGEPSILDAPCSRCGWRHRMRCTDRRLRNARGIGSAVGARPEGKGFASEMPSAPENKQRCARAARRLTVGVAEPRRGGSVTVLAVLFCHLARVCARSR